MGSEFKITGEFRASVCISWPGIVITLLMILFSPAYIFGQCTDPPIVLLSASSGAACETSPFTLEGNTFGGSATSVTIREDGSGSVSPTTANSSPFSFTYTPRKKDIGKVVTITVTSDNPAGSPCVEAIATFSLSVLYYPAPPAVDLVIQPTCDVSTGSIVFSNLPSSGMWTLTRSPGGVTTTGTGTTALISGIPGGTYTYTVSNWGDCQSLSSDTIIIDQPPDKPPAPVQVIDCVVGTDNAGVTVTSPSGPGLEYRLDNGLYQTGTLFENVPEGYHQITVRNSSGCETTGSTFQVSCSCDNTSTLTISSSNISTCYNEPVTVAGNTFGGTATGVILSSDGQGILIPSMTNTSPFDFTYEPAPEDSGKQISITVKTVNTSSTVCETIATCNLNIEAIPDTPVIGSVAQPTCTKSTGSITLTGLPSSGTWIIERFPDEIKYSGSGTSITFDGIIPGTYYYNVTGVNGCVSSFSETVVINIQPTIPAAPFLGNMSPPTCTDPSGSIFLSNLPDAGEWTVTRYPDSIEYHGTGTTADIENIPTGIYYFTVTNEGGCTSASSSGFNMPAQPVTPQTPVISDVTMPQYPYVTGSVTLENLPPSGTWILVRLPDSTMLTGTGTSYHVTDIPAGEYSFSVEDYTGCISPSSISITIPEVDTPFVNITAPDPVCYPATVDLTSQEITAGSSVDLVYTYWKDKETLIPMINPEIAPAGIYYIKGTNQYQFFAVEPVEVIVKTAHIADAGPDQQLENVYQTTLNAVADSDMSGTWSVLSGSASFKNNTEAETVVTNLSNGENVLLWTVSDDVCPMSFDTISIFVNDFRIPSLITPNMDGVNDYFVISWGENNGDISLVIFDRRGLKVYENSHYNNSWNGVDNNGKALPSDTYFFTLRTITGKQLSGYIVVRR